MNEKTLTADGARLLRQARTAIIASPDGFYRGVWDCGTHACIAGWICRCAGVDVRDAPAFPNVSVRNGFVLTAAVPATAADLIGLSRSDRGLQDLFLKKTASRDVHEAAADIDALLWSHGYPPDEIASHEEPASTNAVDPVGEKVTD